MNDIIPINEAQDKEKLLAKQQERFEESLANFLAGKTPKKYVLKRPARGGLQVDYVPGWWVIEQLNTLFNHKWSFEILAHDINKDQVWVKGRLIIHRPNGENVIKDSFGSAEVKYNKESGKPIDIGDDLKAAATDALKKASTLLGIAADVYGKREKEDVGTTLTKELVDKAKGMGMDKTELEKITQARFGKKVDTLDALQARQLLSELE